MMGKNGVLPSRVDMFGPGGTAQLDALDLPFGYSYRLESLRDLIAIYDREVVDLDRRIAAALANHKGYRAIQALNGVGPVLAAMLVTEIGNAGRFASAGRVVLLGATGSERKEPTSRLRCRSGIVSFTSDAARVERGTGLRTVMLVAAVLLAIATTAGPVAAKMPAFDVEVTPSDEPGEFVVRVELDGGSWGFNAPDLDGLLAAFPAPSLSDGLRPADGIDDAIQIRLVRISDGRYEGVVEIPVSDAAWYIVPFPHSAVSAAELDAGGYPRAVRLDIKRQSGERALAVSTAAVASGTAIVAIALRHGMKERRSRAALSSIEA